MPIYEYACQNCARHFEIMQKMSDEPLKVCEACGGTLEKQWSQTGFQFKGAGWYVTDYAKPKADSSEAGKSADAKSDDKSGDKIGGDKGGETKTETKSEAKSETKSEGTQTQTKSDSSGVTSSGTTSSITPTPANAKS